MIKHVIIKNYKGLLETEIEFTPGLNVLVGDNETGKSTVLEAINLALTGQLNRRSAAYELHPFLFHTDVTAKYIQALHGGEVPLPPEVLIEVYFDDEVGDDYRGTNNTRNEDCPGVYLKIALDDKCSEEYAAFIADKDRIAMIPTDYYHVVWESFAQDPMHLRTAPVKPILIDPSAVSNSYAANRYVVEIARDFLSPTQQANVALSYRHMRSLFQDDANIVAINKKLSTDAGDVSDRKLSVGLDMTARASWDASVLPHLDDLPLSQVGKGEQNSIKIKLALKAGQDNPVLLLEEPENHLSHSNLNRLVGYISEHVGERQLIVTTHSSFVLNKLGVESTLLFNGERIVRIGDLTPETRDYFLKLPGHDTLRMVLARRTILVEGPSDELIVQRAYLQTHGRMPLEDGVEVVTVSSLAFRRFLEIADAMKLTVSVVTDNDGDPDKVAEKYREYEASDLIHICFSPDASLPTLEPQILAVNGRDALNAVFGRKFDDDAAILKYMTKNKTTVALKLFQASNEIVIPDYIRNAVQ